MQIQIEEMPGGFLSEISYKKQRTKEQIKNEDDGVNELLELINFAGTN